MHVEMLEQIYMVTMTWAKINSKNFPIFSLSFCAMLHAHQHFKICMIGKCYICKKSLFDKNLLNILIATHMTQKN